MLVFESLSCIVLFEPPADRVKCSRLAFSKASDTSGAGILAIICARLGYVQPGVILAICERRAFCSRHRVTAGISIG
jgi:hypothetical protein